MFYTTPRLQQGKKGLLYKTGGVKIGRGEKGVPSAGGVEALGVKAAAPKGFGFMDQARFNNSLAQPSVLWSIHGEGEGKLLEGDLLRSQ